jgi:chemotaxis protein methyltransferase CheR
MPTTATSTPSAHDRRDPVAAIMALAYDLAGIRLSDMKRPLVEGRLGKRLRQLGCDMKTYAQRCREDTCEQTILIDLLTTNHSAWRREPAHFDDLERRVLPTMAARQAHTATPRLRIWCAAAATGEEPYTIALSLHHALPDIARWDAAILATDISTRALARAKAGLYTHERVSPLSPADHSLALALYEAGPPKVYSVREELRRLVCFARMNLMDDWPMKGPFDVIFCRNVMIYFDQETQSRLVNRMAALLAPGGTLYVGHSESLANLRHGLRTLGPATYAA